MDYFDIENERLDAFLKKAQEDAENNASSKRVSVLDADFLIILSFIAIPFDFVIFFLAFLDVPTIGISWVIRLVVAIPPLLAIGSWHYMRSSKLEKTKGDAWSKYDKIAEEVKKHKESLKAKQQMAELKKSLKLTKSGGKFASQKLQKKALTEAGKKTAAKTAVKKTAVKMGSKVVFKRGGIALIGTIFPSLVAMIPFYTLWMLSTLKDK